MARPRAFDHELLRQLVTEHPTWSDERYAEVLTRHKLEEDPRAEPVNVSSVSVVIHRKRDTWRRQGAPVRDRLVTYSDFMPPAGAVAEEHRNDTALRYLRELAKEARGERPAPDKQTQVTLRRSALNWYDRLMDDGQIVDLTIKGVPVIRSAARFERDDNGFPLAIAAWLLPGWRGN